MVLALTLWGTNIAILSTTMFLLYAIAIESPKMLPIIFQKMKKFFGLAKKGASILGSQKATGTPKGGKYRAKRGFASLFIQIS